jgi:hypothetical protein
LRKQRRLLLKKMRDLSNREARNILELKVDEMIVESVKILEKDRQFLALKALNSLSPRSFSFTVSIGREGSTNPFFKLLNSPDKNVEIF